MIPLDESVKLIAKAEDSIVHAEYNQKAGFLTVTANRAYYAAYYCMTALLYTQNTYAKTHQGTHIKFSELFIKTNIFPISVADDIAFLFKYRQEADYDFDATITEDEAKTLITKATEFLQRTKNYFEELQADI